MYTHYQSVQVLFGDILQNWVIFCWQNVSISNQEHGDISGMAEYEFIIFHHPNIYVVYAIQKTNSEATGSGSQK